MLALRGAAAIAVLTTLAGGVPWLVRGGLAAAGGLWTAMLVEPPAIDGAAALAVLAARELVVGSTFGIIAVVPLLAAAMAGRLVDLAGGGRGPYRAMFGVLAAAVFVGIDGHVVVATAIVESFRAVPVVLDAQPRMLAALGALVGGAVQLAVPWLVTAAVVEIAVGVGARIGGRAALHAPMAAAAPAALAMITATLVSTLAVGIATLVRGAM
ncbi:MAG: flagellar biosynthetic protein FliR [Kofleriaceae bacterium]